MLVCVCALFSLRSGLNALLRSRSLSLSVVLRRQVPREAQRDAQGHDTTPLFGCGKEAKLPNKKLTPNHLVSSMIQEWEQTEHDKCMARRLPGPENMPRLPGPGRLPEPGRTVSAPASLPAPPAIKLDQTTCADQSELLQAAHDAMDERMLLRVISRLRYANTPEGWKLAIANTELVVRIRKLEKKAPQPRVKKAAEDLVAHWKKLNKQMSSSSTEAASSSAAAAPPPPVASSSSAETAPTGEEAAASSSAAAAAQTGGGDGEPPAQRQRVV